MDGFPIPIEFLFFGATLLGIAVAHKLALPIATGGLAVVTLYKVFVADGFSLGEHLLHEWSIVVNLGGLLLGFALLAKTFEDSHVADRLPAILPNGWLGGFVLLVLVAIMSSFLDNIAAAMIGGTIAAVVFKGRVHIGYLAGIVGAANAGGAGSVVGDTTTTMMWIDGISALAVVEAALGAVVCVAFIGFFAARQQHAHEPIQADAKTEHPVDVGRLVVVAMILVGTIVTNVLLDFPAVGVWVAIVVGHFFRPMHWAELKPAAKGAVFLLSLVLTASMMPVEKLPAPSWQTALGLGFVSSVFDNIPLTKLALDQGGYDWGFLAYAVGVGGSMMWFGSSAGVAISGRYPDARNVVAWVKNGWHVAVGFTLGFFVMLFVLGWHPQPDHRARRGATADGASSSTTESAH